jgi:hypothetical protein
LLGEAIGSAALVARMCAGLHPAPQKPDTVQDGEDEHFRLDAALQGEMCKAGVQLCAGKASTSDVPIPMRRTAETRAPRSKSIHEKMPKTTGTDRESDGRSRFLAPIEVHVVHT